MSIRTSASLDFLVVATATPSKIRLADERILQWDAFSKEEQDKMIKIMVKYQQIFIKENHIVFGKNVDDFDLDAYSRKCLECIFKVLFEYPGLEVYRI